jgi:hypothetical protein
VESAQPDFAAAAIPTHKILFAEFYGHDAVKKFSKRKQRCQRPSTCVRKAAGFGAIECAASNDAGTNRR